MLYVQQSLGPDEEIVKGAHCHWMYTVSAVVWILFGLGAAIGLAYAAVWWEVSSGVRELYGSISAAEYDKYAAAVVESRGGYLKILWGLPAGFRLGMLAMFVMGLLLFVNMMVIKATTEIAITTNRLIYKKGLIARQVGELSIDRIEGVTVMQGLLGRIFGYGRIAIRGMGVGEVALPPIEKPLDFRRAIQHAKAAK